MTTEKTKSLTELLPQPRAAGAESIVNSKKASDRQPAGLLQAAGRPDEFQLRFEQLRMEETRTEAIEKNTQDRARRADKALMRTDIVSMRVEDLRQTEPGIRNDAVVQSNQDAVVQSNQDAAVQTNQDAVAQSNPDAVVQTNQDAVTQANQDANIQDTGTLKELSDSLDKVEKAVRAKMAKIQSLLEKLGFHVTPEMLQDSAFLKKIIAIIGDYLKGAENTNGNASITATPADAAQGVVTAPADNAPVAPENVPSVFAVLKNELMQLKALIDLKNFVQKSVAAGENQDVMVARTLATTEETVETALPAGTPANSGTAAPVPATPVNGADKVITVAKPEANTSTASTAEPVLTVVAEKTETSVTQDEAAIPPQPLLHTGKEEKTEIPDTGAKTDPPLTVKPDAKAEAKAALLDALVKAGLLNAEKPATTPVETLQTETKDAKTLTAPAEKLVEAVLKALNGTVEKPEKLSISLEALKKEISTEGQARAGQAKTEGKISLTDLMNQQKGGEKQAGAESQNAASPDPNTAVITDAAPEKSLFSKVMNELKDAITNALMAPKSAGSTATPESAIPHRFSYLTNEHPVPEKAVLSQIINKFQLLHGSGTGISEMRLQLKPDHLGTIKVSIEVNQNVVFTKMEVENEKVKQIIENNVQTLKNALEESGIKVEKFEVSVSQGQDNTPQRELTEQGRRVRESLRAKAGEEGIDGDPDDGTETGRRLGYNTIELVA